MPVSRKSLSIGAAALVAAVATLLIMRQPEQQPAKSPDLPRDLFSFVRSLEDTVPDGRIDNSAAADSIASAQLVRLFDYYLSAIGEKSLDAIRAEIERELEHKLKPETLAEGKRLLARYIDYKHALVDVEKNAEAAGATAAAARARFQLQQDARRRFFSDKEIQAMFGESDAYDLDAISRIEISQDASLSPDQKRERMAQLDAALPAALREAREAPLQVIRLEEAAQKMRGQGASEDDIYRMRAAALSPEAAARLADVDREEQEWRARIAAYLAERERVLLHNASLGEGERQAMLAQLRQSRFTADEQRRLPAYEDAK